MLAASLAPWFNRNGIHYGWVMVALTFLTTVCTSAAISLPSVLLLPMIQEFSWVRADVAGAMGLMLIVFAVTAPFAGALMLRYGLRRVVVASTIMTAVALLGTAQMNARWHLWFSLGILLGTAGGMVALPLSATVANRWFAKRRGLAMGMLRAAFAAGQLSFMPAAAWLATHYGWRMAVLPAIIGAGVYAALFILLARDWPTDVGLAPYGEERINHPLWVQPRTPSA